MPDRQKEAELEAITRLHASDWCWMKASTYKAPTCKRQTKLLLAGRLGGRELLASDRLLHPSVDGKQSKGFSCTCTKHTLKQQ
jgi:hypothetical protein